MKRQSMRRVRVALWVVVAGGLMYAVAPGVAQQARQPATQSSAEDRRLEAIEKQVQALQELVKELRAAEGSDARTAAARVSPSGATTARTTVAASPGTRPTTSASTSLMSDDPIAKIRDEGMSRSQVMQTLSYLTDVIGPRVTGSPNLKRANEWTRERLSSWGLVNAAVEPWGQFGRGWSLKRFSAQVISPQAIPLIGAPKAWTPGLERPAVGDVVHFDARTEGDLAKFRGKLKGAIVLWGSPREVQARFEAPATRVSEQALLDLANSDGSSRSPLGLSRGQTASERRASFSGRLAGERGRGGATTEPTTGPTTGPGRFLQPGRALAFLMKEGAAVVVSSSNQGDGGTLFVSSATVPDSEDRGGTTRPTSPPTTAPAVGSGSIRAYAVDCPPMPAQIALAAEDFNRLVRMIRQGEKLKMEVDLKVEYHTDDLMAYNTVAEIPGTDLADEIVMLGAHLDSWQSGTGATDNGAGVAAVMEAVRILKATGVRPRRTIRIALWTGEEQGLLGSRAYVTKHFGSFEEPATRPTTRQASTRPGEGREGRGFRGRGGGGGGGGGGGRDLASTQPARRLNKTAAYDKFSGYFNLDNGTGKIRGVYMQQNEGVRPIFRKWLAPFADLGASTLTLANTGGTDHQAFDGIGLPGFQFIQDPIEYWSRTHHSNADVYDRAQADDLKQASTIIAAFVYNAATADERLPRKPLGSGPPPRRGPDGIAAGETSGAEQPAPIRD
jgi:hypothetical protein